MLSWLSVTHTLSRQQDSQNIGYVIPTPTIEHFLRDVHPTEPTRTCGFCSLGIFWQALENEGLRRFHRMGPHTSGVYIRGVVPLAAAASHLARGDILLEVHGHSYTSSTYHVVLTILATLAILTRSTTLTILPARSQVDGHRIADDGSFAVGDAERLSFQHLIHRKFPGVEQHATSPPLASQGVEHPSQPPPSPYSTGDELPMRVLRDGRELALSVPVHPLGRLVPATVYDEPQVRTSPPPTLLFRRWEQPSTRPPCPQPYFLYGGLALLTYVVLTN